MHRDDQAALFVMRKKHEVVQLLDSLCRQIEITEPQYQRAKTKYEEVSSWLAESNSPYLDQAEIYPQGSIALGTAIRPVATAEFDVDLVCHLPTLNNLSNPKAVKALIGQRLKEHGTYKGMLEEKRRCWRINYANEFHLDITPSIRNLHCHKGGELVPDKELMKWKSTNPKGYIRKFDEYASMRLRFHLIEASDVKARADITPLPEQAMSKPILKRIVQLLKRHRDKRFMNTTQADVAPISVIITTLAGWAYAKCVGQQVYSDAFDFITAVIREMPTFIHTETRAGQKHYKIENETTEGENFADKWNEDPRLPKAFYEWHPDVLVSLESLLQIEGIDKISESLSNKFGVQQEKTLSSIINPLGQARTAGSLAVASGIRLVGSRAHGSIGVQKNTFFGR